MLRRMLSYMDQKMISAEFGQLLVAEGRDELIANLMKQISFMDMANSRDALNALLGEIQKIQREVRLEKKVAEAKWVKCSDVIKEEE